MGARQGPCPACHREIIAPDPRLGTGAGMVAVPDPPEPPPPFAETDPMVLQEPAIGDLLPTLPEIELPPVAEPVQLPVSVVRASPENADSDKRFILLSYFVIAIVAAGIGYAVGKRSSSPTPAPPPLASTPAPDPAPEQDPPTSPEPTPVLVKPTIKPPPPKVEEAPVKASAAAEATLRAFLEAPDWAARSAYVLERERVKTAMEAYSHEVPDGPTDYKSITVKQSQTDEMSGNTLFIFLVVTKDMPSGIPVAVAETAQGWLIDWPTFVEFRDDQFRKFAEGPANQTGRFHLIVTNPPPARAANTESEHFVSFLLDPPFPDRQQLAFVKKNSDAYATCRAATASGGIFTPVLEITKLATSDGKDYLEILRVIAPDWRPATD